MPDLDAALDDDIGDELLRLIFTACHPILSREARAALALRMICGLTTAEIARAFLVPEATSPSASSAPSGRCRNPAWPMRPRAARLSQRLASVLEVVYLIFNEGYTAARGEEWLRPQLCDEALRMGRVLVALAPDEPEVHGLVALMELNASRAHARTDANGDPILLMDQDRTLWDCCRSAAACGRSSAPASSAAPADSTRFRPRSSRATPRRIRLRDTDWRRIAQLYAELAGLVRSPVIELNRAVAVGMAEGAAGRT